MSQVKYGELESWEEAEVSTQNDFMNLKEGNNVVRVFTNPYQFYVAWVKDTSGSSRKIRSAIENCPLVRAGHKLQARWYLGVIDRKSGQPKILEISTQVFTAIKNYVSDPDWGDITQYDINIKRGPKGTQPLYVVLPKPRKPMTDEEKLGIANFKERVDISKFTTPPTPEEVAEKLGVVVDETPKVAVGHQTVPAQTGSEAGVKPTLTDDDFDFGDEEL